MLNILSQWQVGKYTVLELDGEPPMSSYNEYKVDGVTYKPVPIYDMPGCIAIEAKGNFEGKTIDFI